jgi:hypothetical protein
MLNQMQGFEIFPNLWICQPVQKGFNFNVIQYMECYW